MVLNMISTGAMTRLGYVYGNLMVNVWTKNEKLVQRAIRILEQATGADQDAATSRPGSQRQSHSRRSGDAGRRRAPIYKPPSALKKTKGHVRQAIAIARTIVQVESQKFPCVLRALCG